MVHWMTTWRGMVLAISSSHFRLLAGFDCREPTLAKPNSGRLSMHASLVQLLIVNLLLQLMDGLASYHIISAGIPEENPVVATFIHNWGVAGGLLYGKLLGCALVILIFMLRHRVGLVAQQGLTVLAYVYSCLGVLLMLKLVAIYA